MAKKKSGESEKQRGLNPLRHTREATAQAIMAVVFLALSIFFVLAAFDKAGFVGTKLHLFLKYLFGAAYFLVPIFFLLMSVSFLQNLKREFHISKIIAAVIAFFGCLGLVDLIFRNSAGVVGYYISTPLVKLFDVYASLIVLIALVVITFLFMFDAELSLQTFMFWKKWSNGKKKRDEVGVSVRDDEALEDDEDEEEDDHDDEDEEEVKPLKIKAPVKDPEPEEFAPRERVYMRSTYVPLPLSLLEGDKGKPGVGDIKGNANMIKRTLSTFGIDVEMDEISIGPSVTRYALKPAEGVKLSRIVGLQNDLALALAAHPIRIEAPIPGMSLVGIEIPNSTKTTVGLATLLAAPEFQQSNKPLMISLGKGISGKSHFANLAKMPHLLIAGATGSGKSVTIHSIITSLLYRNSPENLKFILIDPKRVELTLYNKIPHLLTPVITDAKKAILALKWAAKEMDRRYDVFEAEKVRDIESYHKTILEPELRKVEGKSDKELETMKVKVPETMPYTVIVIDELADIMATYPRELEAAIVRLAQMSRAVGIHLILATQRPEVKVITGLIKANVPGRIALKVNSQIDSRTILDTGGAEKLLGAGDLLFLSSEMSKPARIQSSFISETELKKVVKFLADNYINEIPSEINLTPTDKNNIFEASLESDSLEEDDDLYEEARQIVVEAGKASTSYIQRKLRVGYSRAASIMDLLEERGVISAADGAKPRHVIGADASDTTEESVEDSQI